MAKRMSDETYQQILAMLADGRRQTGNMARSGRRGDLPDLSGTDMEAFQLFAEAYQNADDIEELLRRMG